MRASVGCDGLPISHLKSALIYFHSALKRSEILPLCGREGKSISLNKYDFTSTRGKFSAEVKMEVKGGRTDKAEREPIFRLILCKCNFGVAALRVEGSDYQPGPRPADPKMVF